MHWGVTLVVGVVALLLGVVGKELYSFLFIDDSKSESDEIADKAFKLAEDLQKKVEVIKTRLQDVQHRYLTCQDDKLEWQHRYDVCQQEKTILQSKVDDLESKHG